MPTSELKIGSDGAMFDSAVSPLHRGEVGLPCAVWERLISRRRCEIGPPPERGADGSNLRVFGKGKCVFHVDPEIADRVLYLAMAE